VTVTVCEEQLAQVGSRASAEATVDADTEMRTVDAVRAARRKACRRTNRTPSVEATLAGWAITAWDGNRRDAMDVAAPRHPSDRLVPLAVRIELHLSIDRTPYWCPPGHWRSEADDLSELDYPK
jgi:hypothetical protein